MKYHEAKTLRVIAIGPSWFAYDLYPVTKRRDGFKLSLSRESLSICTVDGLRL